MQCVFNDTVGFVLVGSVILPNLNEEQNLKIENKRVTIRELKNNLYWRYFFSPTGHLLILWNLLTTEQQS